MSLNQPLVISPNSLTPDITRDEIIAMQASCREIAARGGEAGPIAERMLRVSQELDALSAEADTFLAQYR